MTRPIDQGFHPRDVNASIASSHGVLIVGAGASGIALGTHLERVGGRYRIVEREDSVAGVPHARVVDSIELGTELVDAKWKHDEQRWQVRLASINGIELRKTHVVVGAVRDGQQMTAQLNITGRDGQTLRAAWSDGVTAYLGIAVPGFPNLFCMQGSSESMARYITSCLRAMAEASVASIEVRQSVHDNYVATGDAAHDDANLADYHLVAM